MMSLLYGYCLGQGAGNAGAKPVDELENGGSKFILVGGYVVCSRFTTMASQVILGEEEASLIKQVVTLLSDFGVIHFSFFFTK